MRQHEKIHTVQRLWPCMHKSRKHQNTDTGIHTQTCAHSHVHTDAFLVALQWYFFFALALERVDAMLSAELLEILRDGVCGSDKVRRYETSLKSHMQ